MDVVAHPQLVILACLVLAIAATWPRVRQPGRRWVVNLSLFGTCVVTRGVLGGNILAMASSLAMATVGSANRTASLPTFVLGLLSLDLAAYLRHRLLHAVPALWRVHGVHHADDAFDWTTAVRFHPVEVALAMGMDALVVALLRLPPSVVLAHGAAAAFVGIVTHTTASGDPASRDSPFLDPLHRILVTPLLHRAHHLPVPRPGNYGVLFSFWDTLGGTRVAPAHPQAPVGLAASGDAQGVRRPHLLADALFLRTGALRTDDDRDARG